jgi:hypothetical protein
MTFPARAMSKEDAFKELLDRLKRAVDPPDWPSLLVFILLKISELDERLRVGTTERPGWSRFITLTYTADGGSITVGLALSDPDPTPGMHGVLLRVDADRTFGTGGLQKDGNPLSVAVTGSGRVEWLIPFGGPLTAPDQAATVNAVLTFDPGIPPVGDMATAGLSVGAASAAVRLSSVPGEPLWGLTLRLGEEGRQPGVVARLSADSLLGDVRKVVQVDIAAVEHEYSPHLTLGPGITPRFSLGPR